MPSPDESAREPSAGDIAGQATSEPLAPPPPSVGEQLRAAREARGLSVADMAGLLKLSPRQIDALEADDWAYLPVKTIIRGFVRNYARALKLDTAALMAALDQAAMPAAPELHMPAATNATVPVERRLARRDYVRVVSGAVLLVLAVLAYFVVPQDFFHSALSRLQSVAPLAAVFGDKAPPVDAPAPAVQAPALVEAPAPQPAAEPTPTPAAVAPAPAVPAAPAAPAAPASAAPAAKAALVFTFRQASWVEVRDRSGEIIFSQLSQAGTQREVEGKPPYSLVVGNAGNVGVTYKGKPVDLSKRSKDDVARVTVE